MKFPTVRFYRVIMMMMMMMMITTTIIIIITITTTVPTTTNPLYEDRLWPKRKVIVWRCIPTTEI